MMQTWSLVNLILAFLTGIAALIFLFHKRDEDLKPAQRRKVHIAKGIALAIAIVSCLIYLFSEDMRMEMVLVDKWTLVMTIMFGGEIMADYFVNKKSHYKKYDEE